MRWDARYRQRAALRRLDARLLDDIGLDEAQRRRACRSWVWA